MYIYIYIYRKRRHEGDDSARQDVPDSELRVEEARLARHPWESQDMCICNNTHIYIYICI